MLLSDKRIIELKEAAFKIAPLHRSAALPFARAIEAEVCKQAEARIAELERIADDLQALCDKQALMLGERDAQLPAPAVVEPVAIVAVSPGHVSVGWMGGYVPKHNDKLYTSPQPQQIAEPKGQESPADAWLRGHIAGLEKAQDVCRIVGAQDTNFEAVDCAYAIYEQKLMVDIFDYMPPPVSTKEPS